MSKLLSRFPTGYQPNPSQVKLLSSIDSAFNQGYKFVVCSAPTGSGKSFISKTLGNASGEPSEEFKDLVNSYQIYKKNNLGGYSYEHEADNEPVFGAMALTITKALQDQYEDLFPDTSILKGKNNYQCSYDTDFTVDRAPCLYVSSIRDTCCSQNTCPYYNARNEALTSRFTALNYSMFFSLPGHVKRREYLICDEAAELEDQLVKMFSCQIAFDTLKQSDIFVPAVPSDKQYDKVRHWLHTLSESIGDRVDDLKNIINSLSKKVKSNTNEHKNELMKLRELHNKIRLLIDTWHDSEYIVEKESTGISFTPLKVNKLSGRVFEHADKVVLMSATIIDVDNFCKTLGIEKSDFKYIEAPSSFSPDKAPILVSTKTKLNHYNLKNSLPGIVKQIKHICNEHGDVKGIIHSQSNFITNYIKNNINNDRFLYREPGRRNESILEQHYTTDEATVLVSPSMSHGVDLKDNLARFQIIIKAPYLPLNDARTKKLMQADFNWYQNKMISSFIQAAGRGIRSADDYCITYVLDAAIIEAVIKNKSKIPKYFIERFI